MQYLLALRLSPLIFLFVNQSWRARDWHCAPWSVPKNGEANPVTALQPS